MEKMHIAEIVSIEGLDILAEPKERATLPIGTLLKTTKVNSIIFIVLDDLYMNMIPGGSHDAYGIPEDKIEEMYPHVSDYLRYLIRIYPLAELEKDHLFPVSKSPVMNALLYEVESEEVKNILENSFVVRELSLIDIGKFPKRNKAIINLLRNYFLQFDENERTEKLKDFLPVLSSSFRRDYASLMEIVRGVKG
jgi:hypothetical protein